MPLAENASMNAVIALVGNKTDLLLARDEVGLRTGEIDYSLFEGHFHVSCLTGQGMEELKEAISAYTLSHLQSTIINGDSDSNDEDLIKLIKEVPPSKLKQCMGMGNSGCKT
jgi:hypothetical protein